MAPLYDETVPVLTNILKALTHILKKAQSWAKEQNVDIKDLLSARLIADMYPLTFQVIVVCGMTDKLITRLTGATFPDLDFRNHQRSVEELHGMIATALQHLGEVKKEDLEKESKCEEEIECQWAGKTYKTTALGYVKGFTMPTAWFHLNIAYAILRMKAVPLGKSDYMKEFMGKFEGVDGGFGIGVPEY